MKTSLIILFILSLSIAKAGECVYNTTITRTQAQIQACISGGSGSDNILRIGASGLLTIEEDIDLTGFSNMRIVIEDGGTFHFHSPTGPNQTTVFLAADGKLQVVNQTTPTTALTANNNGHTRIDHNGTPYQGNDFDAIAAAGGINVSNPLPVELGNFSGMYLDKQILLNWSTITEVNNDYFEVYRSSDLKNWEKIGQVDGNGNSAEKLNYAFADHNPSAGYNYYKLKQVDFNGEFEEHKVIAVYSKDLEYGIYPNPNSGSFTISVEQFESFNKEITYSLRNSVNDVVVEGTLKEQETYVDQPNLVKGIYYLRIILDNEVYTRKVVIK